MLEGGKCNGKKSEGRLGCHVTAGKVIVFKRVVRVHLTEKRHLSTDLKDETSWL